MTVEHISWSNVQHTFISSCTVCTPFPYLVTQTIKSTYVQNIYDCWMHFFDKNVNFSISVTPKWKLHAQYDHLLDDRSSSTLQLLKRCHHLYACQITKYDEHLCWRRAKKVNCCQELQQKWHWKIAWFQVTKLVQEPKYYRGIKLWPLGLLSSAFAPGI